MLCEVILLRCKEWQIPVFLDVAPPQPSRQPTSREMRAAFVDIRELGTRSASLVDTHSASLADTHSIMSWISKETVE